MKNIIKTITILFLSISPLLLSSCEEVINVELDDTDPQIVIEATISATGQNLVTIIKSTDFYNPSEYNYVSGAEVVVSESSGEIYLFTETSPGQYTNPLISTKIGSEYKISVNHDNTIYSAKSLLPQPIVLDSIAAIGEKRPFRDELNYEYHAYFQDHPNVEDYARFRIYINGIQKPGIFRYDDRLSDGKYIDFNRFFFQDNKKIKLGDTVTIEMLTIDNATFEYFDTLRRVLATSTGGPFGPSSPSNPTSNWDNGAFGYFSVYSIDSKTVIIE